jgi:hypothetical protein
MKKKSSPGKASHTRLPKGHQAYNLPPPQGGDFQGAQLNSPMGMGGISPGMSGGVPGGM